MRIEEALGILERNVGSLQDVTAIRAAVELVELIGQRRGGNVSYERAAEQIRDRDQRITKLWTRLRQRAAEPGQRAEETAQRAADAKQRAVEVDSRYRALKRAGLSQARARAMAEFQQGPYDVLFAGVRQTCDELGIAHALRDLGYPGSETARVLERVKFIEPEVLAFGLDQSDAVAIKLRFDEFGGKVQIKRGVTHVQPPMQPRPAE